MNQTVRQYSHTRRPDSHRLAHNQVTRALAKFILHFMAKFYPPGLHYSFGDKEARVLPHIVLPLSRAVDRLIVTPNDDAPPELGLPLEVRRDTHLTSLQPPLRHMHLQMSLSSITQSLTHDI